jgi:F-type H+-transporting ATPase subunit a
MASAVLHIKDSYYFEIPKSLWSARYDGKADFPNVWVKNDPDFQEWEAERLYEELSHLATGAPPLGTLIDQWHHWQHADHANFGKPLHAFLESRYLSLQKDYAAWKRQDRAANAGKSFTEYLKEHPAEYSWFAAVREDSSSSQKWQQAKVKAGNGEAIAAYKADAGRPWDAAKIDGYNTALKGKILIPQPFGELRNFYEKESGFCISRFMIIELVVAILLAAVFCWLAARVRSGGAPRGRIWNLLESVLLFLRDEVARPAIGKHDADRFVPLLWTIFLFVLGCNLMGMMPWAGAPTGAFGVTLGLALVTFGTVVVCGSAKFGIIGFWLNQVPHMQLPLAMAVIIKPMIFLIEVLGLFIKHGVLGIRLLANMVAGHLVLLGIMALAFSLEGAMNPNWWLTAVIAVVASTLFSCLELFVAFLQAYIFTFLSALFIGAAVHHH